MKAIKKKKSAWDNIEANAVKGSKLNINPNSHLLKIMAGVLIYFAGSGIVANVIWIVKIFV